MINEIKGFLKQNGLEWTGDISTYKNQDFKPAKEEDFKDLDIIHFLISFENEGYMAIGIELDLIRFTILGESIGVGFDKYAGNEKNKKLFEERDLSKEWIDFQLKNNTLVYASLLRKCCEKERKIINTMYDGREERILNKIEELQRRTKELKLERNQKLEQINQLEQKAEEAENTL